jgi:hypothetical protein
MKLAHLLARLILVGGYTVQTLCCHTPVELMGETLVLTSAVVLLLLWLNGDDHATE